MCLLKVLSVSDGAPLATRSPKLLNLAVVVSPYQAAVFPSYATLDVQLFLFRFMTSD